MGATVAETKASTELTLDQIEALLELLDMMTWKNIYSLEISPNSCDSQGRTALHMAAANGHLEIVEYLIQNGAEVNALNSEKNSPLHWALLDRACGGGRTFDPGRCYCQFIERP